MSFRVGEVVRIRQSDMIRGGETGVVRKVMPRTPGMENASEYLLEFQNYPAKLRTSNDRFFLCIYREDDLSEC
jgi:hypothetical protein